MRLEGGEPGRRMSEAWLALSRDEAARLKDVLDFMLSADADTDPEWHAQVPSDDGAAEITVGWDAREVALATVDPSGQ